MMRILVSAALILLIGCQLSGFPLVYEAAPGTPRDWLQNGFGQKTFSNTWNFYIENNPWSLGYQRAISISENNVYLVSIQKDEEYEFYYYEISQKDCDGLAVAVVAFKEKYMRYEIDPQLAEDEAVIWLDGPDYTIEKFGENLSDVEFINTNLWGHGNIVSLAYDVLSAAENCASNKHQINESALIN